MDHAEFPDYVSDIAKNIILALCRWDIPAKITILVILVVEMFEMIMH